MAASSSTEFSAALLARYSEPSAAGARAERPICEDSTASLPRRRLDERADHRQQAHRAESTLVCIT